MNSRIIEDPLSADEAGDMVLSLLAKGGDDSAAIAFALYAIHLDLKAANRAVDVVDNINFKGVPHA